MKKHILIIGKKPPNWNLLEKTFGVDWENTVVTYGNKIYSSRPIPPDLEAHEKVHVKQQGIHPIRWWNKYIKDPEFRLSQEIESYKAQIKYIRLHSSDRNYIHKLYMRLVADLSSKMYGNCISYTDAYNYLMR